MEKAKAAVGDFLHKHGNHSTTIEERTAPAVTQENVTKTKHDDVNTAVDREVHQDHYHTSVQPVKDHEVLPEQHHHKALPVEHREYQHGDTGATKSRLQEEAAQFKDSRTYGDTQHTRSEAPTVGGEHRHHHVHETIQPVIEKQTVQPSVTHTTVPVHEVHHNEARHHKGDVLPTVTMDEFRAQDRSSTTGSGTGPAEYRGEPGDLDDKRVGGSNFHHGKQDSVLGNRGVDTNATRDTTGLHHGNHDNTLETRGVGTNNGKDVAGLNSGNTGHVGTRDVGTSNTTDVAGVGNEGHRKPSLLDKLNPKVDSDGDGKKGFLK